MGVYSFIKNGIRYTIDTWIPNNTAGAKYTLEELLDLSVSTEEAADPTLFERNNGILDYNDSWADELSEEELRYIEENTAPTELIDTTHDVAHEYIDSDGNVRYWYETDSPFVDQEDTGGSYFPDSWGQEDVKSGSRLYQISREGEAGRSSYYFDEETANLCRDENGEIDPERVKSYLQINDPNNEKNTITAYEVTEDMEKVPAGHAEENTWYGEGGGKQYYIRNTDSLQEVDGPNITSQEIDNGITAITEEEAKKQEEEEEEEVQKAIADAEHEADQDAEKLKEETEKEVDEETERLKKEADEEEDKEKKDAEEEAAKAQQEADQQNGITGPDPNASGPEPEKEEDIKE